MNNWNNKIWFNLILDSYLYIYLLKLNENPFAAEDEIQLTQAQIKSLYYDVLFVYVDWYRSILYIYNSKNFSNLSFFLMFIKNFQKYKIYISHRPLINHSLKIIITKKQLLFIKKICKRFSQIYKIISYVFESIKYCFLQLYFIYKQKYIDETPEHTNIIVY